VRREYDDPYWAKLIGLCIEEGCTTEEIETDLLKLARSHTPDRQMPDWWQRLYSEWMVVEDKP